MSLSLAEHRERKLDDELDAWIDEKTKGVKLAAPIGAHAKVKLRNILKYYAKKDHPFRDCVKDNRSRFGPGRVEAVCATLKDTIKGNKSWRSSGGHKMSDGDLAIDGDVLMLLDAVSERDLQEIFLEARAMDEYQTVEGVPLLGVSGEAELRRWGADGEIGLAVLDAAARKRLKPEDFALPPDDYPMQDRDHAIRALGRAKQHATPEQQKTIKTRVCNRYPNLPACKEGGS